MENEDDLPPDEIREASEVAKRALALFGVWWFAVDSPRDDAIEWIKSNDLMGALSPKELEFVSASARSKKQIIDYSWHCERLLMLLWALGVILDVPTHEEQCDPTVFKELFCPLSGSQTEKFVKTARLRPDDEIWEMEDRIFDLHWQARDAALKGNPSSSPVDPEVIQERHHGINWVTGYCELDWDDVTTDT